MFAEERPHLQPLPLEPFRYYRVRRPHGASRRLRRGRRRLLQRAAAIWLGTRLPVQWDDALRAPARSAHRPAPARASAPRARAAIGSATTIGRAHAAEHRAAPRPRRHRGPVRSGALRRHPSPRRDRRHPPHPRRPRAREDRHGVAAVDDAVRRRARARRPQLSLRPPLSRAARPAPLDAPPDRSAHPAAHPLPRSHRSPDRRTGDPE